MTIVQLEDVYGNIGRACFTSGKLIFGKNMSKQFLLTTTYLDIICVNDNDNNIKILFSIFLDK